MKFLNRVRLIKKEPEVTLGLLDLVLGKYIGSGCYRDVYQHSTNKDWVVKLMNDAEANSNLLEFEIWQTVKDTPWGKWFAPCPWCSDNGKTLIQEKVEPITKENIYLIPDKIPYFFTDLKPTNFGFIGKQLVCHDYDMSLVRFVDNGLNNKLRSSKDLKNIMKVIQKELKVGIGEYYNIHLTIINSILPVKLTDKEIDVLAGFMSLDKTIIENDMFNTLARKKVKEKLDNMSAGALGNHLKSMIEKGFLDKDEITNKISVKEFLIPEDEWQGYQFKIVKG